MPPQASSYILRRHSMTRGGGHPEHQGCLRAVASAVGKHLPELHGRVEQFDSFPATLGQLERIHPLGYLTQLQTVCSRAEKEGRQVLVGPETPMSGASWEAWGVPARRRSWRCLRPARVEPPRSHRLEFLGRDRHFIGTSMGLFLDPGSI